MLEREAMAILVSARGVFYAAREAALNAAGSALALLADPYAYAGWLGKEGARALERAIRSGDQTLEKIYGAGVHLIARGEEGYPQRLAQIARPPHLLYVQGCDDLSDALPVGIVGTRQASDYGLRHTRAIARDLALSGACIVSGLALGVDAAAHEGALDAGGRTIAVLGGAHDRFYPSENRLLRDRILDCSGSIISEYPMGMSPTRYSFLHRNRIIAGLSMGVLVTEGAQRSGAQRTASDAADFGREVFALPGSVDSAGSQLPHKLIAEGAHLTSCAADVLQVLAPQLMIEMGMIKTEKEDGQILAQDAPAGRREDGGAELVPKTKKEHMRAIPAELPQEEQAVLKALSGGEQEFDALCEATGMDGASLGAVLMGLEMDGLVVSLPGLRYAMDA